MPLGGVNAGAENCRSANLVAQGGGARLCLVDASVCISFPFACITLGEDVALQIGDRHPNTLPAPTSRLAKSSSNLATYAGQSWG